MAINIENGISDSLAIYLVYSVVKQGKAWKDADGNPCYCPHNTIAYSRDQIYVVIANPDSVQPNFLVRRYRHEIDNVNLETNNIALGGSIKPKLKFNMNFGQAIEALKKGQYVTRKDWNGKGMFLWLKPAATVKAEWCKDPKLKNLAEANGGEIEALGTICMFTAQRQILSGWLASQTDMLAEDWVVLTD